MALVDNRYARAMAEVVFGRKLDATQTVQQVHSMVDLVNSSQELRHVWDNPAIPVEQKRSLLDAITSRLGTFREVRNFIAVLIDHQRLMQLPEIAEALEHAINEQLGLAEAEVTSARELSEREKSEIERQIGAMTGKRVRAKYATDRALIGGAIVKLGSTIYDGSVRGQLHKMKEQLINQ
jgi:F-type H+-transporting ATPase subunit delta